MDADGLARYADAIVRDALRLGEGDVLAAHGEPAHRELLVALAEAGYRAGCRYCDVLTTDLRLKRVRALHAPLESLGEQPAWHDRRMRDLLAADAGVVTVNGPEEPGLLGDVPPERAARETSRILVGAPRYLRALKSGDARFCVIAWPTPAWASQVYPELERDAAVTALGDDLLRFARLAPDDPPDGWAQHVARLQAVATELTRYGLRELTLRGPGTELRLRLPEGARWIGGTLQGRHGRFSPNVPTEEVFTSPSPRATEGTFACSRPLELEGRTLTGIHGEFRGGRLERIAASRPEDSEFLQAYLARDSGAGRLGEVALVDGMSRVGAANRGYGTTLLDENAASHMALGSGFDFARDPGAERPNSSRIHVDVMIGRPELEVHGRDATGRQLPVLVDGVLLP
ncbi:MAG: aminopeptidase [Gaiellales bacterium]|nr:aminopeptidase [Gaiellales bacterium]